MTSAIPSEVALAELARVRAYAARQVAMGADRAQATAHVAKWCAIAAWFGAVLPDELAMYSTISAHPEPVEGRQPQAPLWTDYAPPGTPIDAWRHTIALELRSYTQRAVAKAEAEQSPASSGEALGVGPVFAPGKALDRARNLLTLARHLSRAAGLPAMAPEERKAA
jgi:hypothetical protein